MKDFLKKWLIYVYVAIMVIVCLSGVFKLFNPVSLCVCFVYFLILIGFAQLSPVVLILVAGYVIAFASCILWCLCTTNEKRAYRLFMLTFTVDFLLHTIALSWAITFFNVYVINATVAKLLFLVVTAVWYKLKISRDAKFVEKLYSISSKRLYICFKYATLGIMIFKLIGTLIYTYIRNFFVYPYTVISITTSPFISYENNLSGFQNIFECFVNVILLINLISTVFMLKKKGREGLFLLTYLMIAVSDFICSHYIKVYQESIKTTSIILSFVFLIIGIFASLVWKIELNKSKRRT